MRNLIILIVSILFFWGCKKTIEFTESMLDERLTADILTAFDESSQAYTHEFSGLNTEQQYLHDLGDKFFGQTFVTSPAPKFGGLGPIFNNVSCQRCHTNEGRGFPLNERPGFQTTFLKVASLGEDIHGGPMPLEGFGIQIQDQAIAGVEPEASFNIQWETKEIKLSDGEIVYLRKPAIQIKQSYIPFPTEYLSSLRMARPNYGMGLLEAIEGNSILKNQDIQDADGDGVSGKANYVYDPISKSIQLGRIGWKAGVPNIKTQVAKAFNEDIGVTSSLFPLKNAWGQTQMSKISNTSKLDVADSVIHAVAFYMKSLTVPARRNIADLDVIQGKKIFQQIGCNKCHVQYHNTKVDVTFPQLSNLIIQPFTDMLLHNMGPDLADNLSEYLANGNEWRTPPLWGISLTKKVNGNQFFLHDGRARTLLEAILWHGGEAEAVKSQVIQMSKSDRDKLIKFIESL